MRAAPMRDRSALKFDMRAIRKNDRLARIELRVFVSVAPQQVEACCGVQTGQAVSAAVSSGFLRHLPRIVSNTTGL
jgi:hypothetical protein